MKCAASSFKQRKLMQEYFLQIQYRYLNDGLNVTTESPEPCGNIRLTGNTKSKYLE